MYFNTNVLIASDSGNDTESIENVPAEQCSQNDNSNAPSNDTHVMDNFTTNIPNTNDAATTDIGSDIVSDIYPNVPNDVDTTSLINQSLPLEITTQSLQPSSTSECIALCCTKIAFVLIVTC